MAGEVVLLPSTLKRRQRPAEQGAVPDRTSQDLKNYGGLGEHHV